MGGALDELEQLIKRDRTRVARQPPARTVTRGNTPKIEKQAVVVKSGDLDAAVKAEHMKTITTLQEASEMTLPEWCEVVRTECVDLEARLVAVGKTHGASRSVVDDMVERAINKVKADAFETIILNDAEGM